MNNCSYCNKEISAHTNYCNWECQIAEAIQFGYKIIAPNNLPIRCIAPGKKAVLEHYNADHPNYKYPFAIIPNDDSNAYPEFHAMIYYDEHVILSIGDARYGLWSRASGQNLGKEAFAGYVIQTEDLEKIERYIGSQK